MKKKPPSIWRSIVLMVLAVSAAAGCKESIKFTGPDGVVSDTDPGFANPWSEPALVGPGQSHSFYGLSSSVGGRFAFEIDWDSPTNDVSFVVYREEWPPGESQPRCSLPVPLGPPQSGTPRCPVAASNHSGGKPRRVEFESEGEQFSYLLTVTNNGPDAENVRLREIEI